MRPPCVVDGCVQTSAGRGYCSGHWQRWRKTGDPGGAHLGPLPEADRFWPRVQPADADECWLWTGATSQSGYGRFTVSGRYVSAHRWSYEALIGDIPDGFHLDHLCRTRQCVNPYHLDPVPPAENNRRSASPSAVNANKTHCTNGHEFDASNTYIYGPGYRQCKTCRRAARLRHQAAA